MKATKKAYNPEGIEIRFYEDEHKYETDNCKDFTSATTFIHKFFPEFDSDTISKRYAKKHDRTQQDVLDEWNAINVEANLQGTNVHLYCENKLIGKKLPEPRNEKEVKIRVYADEAIDKLLAQYELVETEKIIFSEKHKIAGTIDLVLRDKKTGEIVLLDWKTNKEIVLSSYWKKYGFCPVEHLESVNYNHYSLQLNLYRYLLLKENYYENVGGMKIVHLKPDGGKWYDIGDMRKEILKMVHYKDNKSEVEKIKELMRSIRMKSKR